MHDADAISIRAHAKLNLALAVGPPVPDGPRAGFHPICSWMHAIELADEVRVGRLGEGRPSGHEVAWADGSPIGWAIGDDLAVRAHRTLEAETGRKLPAAVRVTKHIPTGGGLGGGSSDAAATLLALDRLFALGLGEERLGAVGARLGSDVPFFIDAESFVAGRPPRPAIVSGFGERVERLERRAGPVTLVCPPFGCATPEVYRAFDATTTDAVDEGRTRAAAGRAPLDAASLFNDLTAAALAVRPELRPVLSADGALHLSGSGSTAFVIGDARGRLGGVPPGCRVIPTRLA